MFRNVLVGVDGSSNGRDGIALALRLLDQSGKLTLAHVSAKQDAAAVKLLEDERAAAGVEAEIVSVRASSPGAGLHQRAEEQAADLLVVGSCGRGAFGRVMIGDDTRAALNGAPCAVAIGARGYSAQPTPIAKIGVAYNGSPESAAALAKARELAVPTSATIIALEVVSIPTYAYAGVVAPTPGAGIDAMVAEAQRGLDELEGVEGRAVYGLPTEELAEFGDEVDLLVVGSRSYGPVRRLVLGSTSDYLERHARCSLLVLPRLPERE
jgi:nucleotide-binding universal stress UspA family protein